MISHAGKPCESDAAMIILLRIVWKNTSGLGCCGYNYYQYSTGRQTEKIWYECGALYHVSATPIGEIHPVIGLKLQFESSETQSERCAETHMECENW